MTTLPPTTPLPAPVPARLARQAVLAAVLAVCCSYAAAAAESRPSPVVDGWTRLLDGKNLGKWEVLEKYDFKRHGKVQLDHSRIVLPVGAPGTGVRWTGSFPRMDYEVTLEGRRTKGDDFFCGMTFPVGKRALTLVLGGWGGEVTGLSSIDDEPAVENETCRYVDYEQGRWYRIRVKVTRPRVEVWLDKEKIIDLKTEQRKLSIYWEVEPCLPFGVATWRTGGELRDLRVRSGESGPSRPGR